MRFNPMVDEPMLTVYEDLLEIIKPQWENDPNLDKIIRYIIIAYDPESPVCKTENEFNVRRAEAVRLADFDEGPDFHLLLYKHEYVYMGIENMGGFEEQKQFQYLPQLITGYLKRFARSKEHAAILATEFAYWESIMKMFDPISGKNSKEELESVQKKNIIVESIPKYLESIRSFYRDFYSGDIDLADEAELSVNYSAESVAHVLKNKRR